MKTRIAINGFGRIGRVFLRAVLNNPNIEVVAINDLASAHTMSHLFKYDSIHGVFDGDVQSTDDLLIINNHSINYFSSSKIEDISWQKYNIDIVVECTGLFKDRKSASAHLNSGAKKVIICLIQISRLIQIRIIQN